MMFLIYLPAILTTVLLAFYAERKLAAFIQNRLGPTHVGVFGVLQPIADLIKLVQKEDLRPTGSYAILFKAAPLIILTSIITAFVVLPLAPNVIPANANSGVFFLLAVVALDVAGLLMAGWSSNNKYSLLGAVRSVAQIISYEIPAGLTVLAMAFFSQSLDLTEISQLQGVSAQSSLWLIPSNYLNLGPVGGFLTYNIFKNPFVLLLLPIYYITTLAECNRAPFDIPEGESEIIGGFHTEYSGFRFSLFFLAEYALMMLVAALGSILFLGGFNSPLPNIGSLKLADLTNGESGTIAAMAWGGFWLWIKTYVWMLTHIWLRWSLPRFRADRLMDFGWKVLTPLSLLIFVLLLLTT